MARSSVRILTYSKGSRGAVEARMAAVVIERKGPVCRLVLDRPNKLNALSEGVRRELHEAFSSLPEELDVRVIVLSGAGRAFSAGIDLSPETGSGEASWSERRHASGAWQRLLELIESVPQVTVASIRGHCIGGGALLAASCDIRIAGDDLSVRIPELAIGIPLAWGGVPRLVREIGLPMTRDLVMTGRTLDALGALACGFVQRVVPEGTLDEATTSLVGELLDMPEAPLAMTKAMFAAMSRERLGSAGWADADLLAWSRAEPESAKTGAEYLRRLREKKRS